MFSREDSPLPLNLSSNLGSPSYSPSVSFESGQKAATPDPNLLGPALTAPEEQQPVADQPGQGRANKRRGKRNRGKGGKGRKGGQQHQQHHQRQVELVPVHGRVSKPTPRATPPAHARTAPAPVRQAPAAPAPRPAAPPAPRPAAAPALKVAAAPANHRFGPSLTTAWLGGGEGGHSHPRPPPNSAYKQRVEFFLSERDAHSFGRATDVATDQALRVSALLEKERESHARQQQRWEERERELKRQKEQLDSARRQLSIECQRLELRNKAASEDLDELRRQLGAAQAENLPSSDEALAATFADPEYRVTEQEVLL